MVIECTECHTRFKLADDKVKPGGTRVRCSKCKQIFTVMPPEPAPAPPPATPPREEEIDFGEFNMERLAEPAATPPAAESAATDWDRDRAEPSAEEFSFGQTAKEEFAFGGDEEAGQTGEFTFGAQTEAQPEDAGAGQAAPEEFAFGGEEAGTQPADDTFGFEESAEFSFGEEQAAGEGTAGPEAFSFDAAGTTGSVEFAFDEGESGAEAGTEFSWDEEERGGEEGFDFAEGREPTAEGDEFDFSGMTFGEEEAAPSGPAGEEERLAPAQAPPGLLETELLRPQQDFPPPRAASTPQPEPLPFAAPAARRRKSPIQGLMFFIGLLLLAMTGGAVYFYWQGGIPALTSLVDRLTGQTLTPQVNGQIRIEGLTSFYVANQEAGQLLVIQGKAINDYPETRSSLAVKGILFNKEGQALVQQTVFCGNPLDQETLKKLPYAKIEESMNNPFGESLSNLNVAPGKAISFTIVFRNLPADIAEFTVEATDSKPGTKQ